MKSTFGLFTFLVLVALGAALECFDCDEPGVCSTTKVCEGSCFNYTMYKDDKFLSFTSDCWPQKMETKCTKKNEAGVTSNRCYCNENGCNDASVPGIAFMMLVFAVFIHCFLGSVSGIQ